MTPAYPTGLERTILRAIRQRQQSEADPVRWMAGNDIQASTIAALLTSHTAAEWTASTGVAVSAPQLAAQRAEVELALRRAFAAAAGGDLTRAPSLVARDLVTQARVALSAQAAQVAGVRLFRWRTKRDERVRPEHRALEGRVFDVSSGAPGVGLPGEPWGCRCSMEPVP